MILRWLLERRRLAREETQLRAYIEALFHAAAQRPFDDGPLLELAEVVPDPNWRDLIHKGIELAHIYQQDPLPPEETYSLLRSQVSDFERKHDSSWEEPVLPWLRHLRRLRGVVDGGFVDAADFLRNGSLLFELRPIIYLGIRNIQDFRKGEVFRSPLLARLRALNLSELALDDSDMERLASSPYVHELRWISLAHNRITDEGLHILARSDCLPQLRWLDISWNPCENPSPKWLFWWDYDMPPLAPEDYELYYPPVGQMLEERYGKRRWISEPPRAREWHSPYLYYWM